MARRAEKSKKKLLFKIQTFGENFKWNYKKFENIDALQNEYKTVKNTKN